MDVNYLVLLFVAIIMALAYGILGFFSARQSTGEAWDWIKFAATVVYSIIVGILAVQTKVISLDTLANWQSIFSAMWIEYVLIYTGLLYVFQKFVVPLWDRLTTRTQIFPRSATIDPNRHMDAETRRWLVSDNPANADAILKSIDEAEEAKNQRYIVDAGYWVYAVEFGIVFAAKHYLFRFFGRSNVSWKAISAAIADRIHKTGRVPSIGDL